MPSMRGGQCNGPARKPAPNLVCGVATLQLWPETLAFQTPATLAAVRSAARAGAEPSGGKDATCVFPGAVGNFDGSVAPGAAGGGSWLAVTWPARGGCRAGRLC